MLTTDAVVRKQMGLLRDVRIQSDQLFEILEPGSIYDRPIDARHRVIFYIGHLDGFDSIQICREGLGLKSTDPELDDLFQAGIDPDSEHLPTDQPSDWPSLEQVREYVNRCRSRVDRYLESAPVDVVSMSLEHRLMHLETLAYMFHNFDYRVKRAPGSYSVRLNGTQPADKTWIEIPRGEAVLGKPDNGEFGWDNEYSINRVFVPAFQIQRYAVTNRDYLRFVKEGAPLPNFWIRRGDNILLRAMFEEVALPLDWPVYVTQMEAAAYAKWEGARLMTEAEFHRAAYGSDSLACRRYPWGNGVPRPHHGNFDFDSWDPTAVTSTPAGDSAFGVSQLIGNGWEWTSTPFGPFDGFSPRPEYPGYSANFFDGEHFVMKGASPRTSAALLRPSFRNWFRRDYPYMYAKFRCVKDTE